MKRPFILSLLVTGLSFSAPFSQAETLPLPLTGPAYAIANEAYMAYNRKDYDLAIAKANEALRQRGDADQLRDLIRDHPQRVTKLARNRVIWKAIKRCGPTPDRTTAARPATPARQSRRRRRISITA